MKTLSAFFVLTALLPAQVNSPRLGAVRFADGTVRAVRGLPRNLLVSAAALASADFASFSDAGGLVSRNGVIRLLGPDGAQIAEYASGETAPVLNIDDALMTAIAWLPSQRALLRWNGNSFVLHEAQAVTWEGEATCVQLLGPGQARLLVTHADASVSTVVLSLETGNVVSSDIVPAVRGRAFAQQSFLVFQSPQGLIVESPNGGLRTVPLIVTDPTIERMASDWLHISSASMHRDWALYLNGTNLQLSILPSPPASASQEAVR